MLDKIRQLGSDTAVYGVSTIIGRFLNFLLVPFYTNVLPPSEYGIVAYIYSYIAFMNIIYGYGMESAYFRYASSLEIGSEKLNFTIPFLSLVATSLFFSGIIHALSVPIASLLKMVEHDALYVQYAAWILFFDTLTLIPFAALRLERRAVRFALIRLMNIILNVALNIVLLVKFHLGVQGIFISGVVSSAFTVLLLLPTVIRQLGIRSEPRVTVSETLRKSGRELYSALLKFGLPYVPAGLAAMAIQVIDRPILRAFTNDATVGIYQANYRLGILMMIIVSMFDYAWRPFFLTNANDPQAKPLFARVLTYFLFVALTLWLIGSLFVDDIVRIRFFGRDFIHPAYWSGLGIVPIVLFAYVFTGISTNLIAGIYIEKKTHYLPWINGAGAVVNIAANIVLIPVFSLYGAAFATLLSYMVAAVLMFFVVQRFFPIRYEYSRILKLFASSVGMYLFFRWVPVDGTVFMRLAWKSSLVLGFVAILLVLRFFRKDEIRAVRQILRFSAQEAKPPVSAGIAEGESLPKIDN